MKTITLTIAQQATLYKVLRQYLHAGFSLAQAFTMLAEQEHGDRALAQCWQGMARRLNNGQSLVQAAKGVKLTVPEPWLLIASESGFYEAVFAFLADRSDELYSSIATIKTRTVMPIALFCVLCFIRHAQSLVLGELSLWQYFLLAIQPIFYAAASIAVIIAGFKYCYASGHGLVWKIPVVFAWQKLQFSQALVLALNSREDLGTSLSHLIALLSASQKSAYAAQLQLMKRGKCRVQEVIFKAGYFNSGEHQLLTSSEKVGAMGSQAESLLIQHIHQCNQSREQTLKFLPWILYGYLLLLLLYI